MILPALALAIQLMAIEMRMTRTTMLEVRGFRADRPRQGFRNQTVVFRHALRNALIPVVTVIGFQLGTLMGASAIIEVIFGLNGVGYTLLQAIFNRDYPLVQAATLYLATAFVLINLAVDMLYAYLDPGSSRDEQATDTLTLGRVGRSARPWWTLPQRWRNPIGLVGAVVVLLTVVVALAAPLIAPYDRTRRRAIASCRRV